MFKQEARSLKRAWESVFQGKKYDMKSQRTYKNLEQLYEDADLLNPLLIEKATAWASKFNGDVIKVRVKDESRSLEKTFRIYEGDWRKLCDLTRTTIVFNSLKDLTNCFVFMSQDSEIELIYVGDEKFRFDIESESLSGYRDIQLSCRLRSKAAVSRRLDNHIVEIQLNLTPIIELKSDEGCFHSLTHSLTHALTHSHTHTHSLTHTHTHTHTHLLTHSLTHSLT